MADSRQNAIDVLRWLGDECRRPNWDGYNAFPVTEATVRVAREVLDALPSTCPDPELGAEPAGYITMEWHQSARQTLSVSVTSSGELYYAALFGMEQCYGERVFRGQVPEVILDLIRRVYTQ